MKKGKIIFEGMIVFVFVCILVNIGYSFFYSYELLNHYTLTNNLSGVIVMSVILLGTYVIFPNLDIFMHENGHKLIYTILGEKSEIKRKSFFSAITIPEHEDFNDNLQKNNPVSFSILCLSGVTASIIISIILFMLINILALISMFSSITTIYPLGYIALLSFSYNLVLLNDFISNLWSKRSNTDGYKARQIFLNSNLN